MRHPQESTTPDEPLVVRLRELKDRTGLSLAALAARTPYSKSAWHRYLTGIQRPPRPAVEALCRLAGSDPATVLALWEAADGPPAAGPPRDGDGKWRASTRWLPLPALALLVVAAAVALPGRSGAPASQVLATAHPCHGRSCQGELPDASVCARDARTESTVTGSAYDVRLRYSPGCGTAWSEVRMRAPRSREVSVRAGQDALSASYPSDGTAGNTSPMLAVRSPREWRRAWRWGELACTGLDVEPAGPE